MQDYHNLAVWQKAQTLALNVHRLTDLIPRRGNSGLASQLRRAALSIPTNIAEGRGRASDSDFAKFIQIAIGSSSELECHLEFVAEAKLIPADRVKERLPDVIEVRRMLIGLMKKLRPQEFSS
jgi:four helix bundle protein